MSSNIGSERRVNHRSSNRPRFTSNAPRQAWIPRGANSDSPMPSAPNPVPSANSNPVENVARAPSAPNSVPSSNSNPVENVARAPSAPNSVSSSNSNPVENVARTPSRRSQAHGGRSQFNRQTVRHRRDSERERTETQENSMNRNNDRRVSKDTNLPQLVQEIEEKLARGEVECMICYDTVRRSAAIWSCNSCYSIFHLNCIKKWARAPVSGDISVEKNQGFNWRCPGCQFVQLTSSKEIRYLCFCGKRPDPPSDLYLTPHSCGEPCGKPLESDIFGLCPHVCVLRCHPGPCPPCKQFAPPRLCPCGKKTVTTRCSDGQSVLTCGNRCDKALACGRHRCERICHVGSCDECHVVVDASCFCKKKLEVVLCGEMTLKGEVKAEDGVFSCSSHCGMKLGCGNHLCREICHPGPCGECNLLPSKIKTCHCGKTISEEERGSCLDPIPTCTQKCEKPLPCGEHHCEDVCHAGDCPPCLVEVSQKCRCSSTFRTIECYKSRSGEKFTCEMFCGRKKNCGRHRCNERCCPLSNSSNTYSGEWDPHFCSIQCGKNLRCGQHSCKSLCHSGHCPPCLETIFSDLTCACGRTSLPPPLPCGTQPPSCQLPCSVPQPCGHLASHVCHFGDCPPCSVPVAKECVGGHVVLRNIPCGSRDITCNKLCGKTRRCGMHACGRTCHPYSCDGHAGPEPGTRSSCGQTCGAPRRDCRHTCTSPCHPASICPDVRCDFPVKISCSCGRISANVPCDAGGTSGSYNPDSLYEASVMQKLPVPLQPVEGTKIPLGQRKLMCDEDCAKLERKRVLADAFDIAPPNLEALQIGESEFLADLYRRDSKWVLSVEERCKYLVLGKSRGATSGLKVHVFSPTSKDKRDAIRVIAGRWKLLIHSAGWEPKRFIVVHATPKSKAPPRILGVKGSTVLNPTHPPVFDALVDMDPRLVVSFADLPREADISALVLRFGGECELVWLNDRNALAIFHDPARAATAMRRLDHASVYIGAVTVHPIGGAAGSSGTSAWGGTGVQKGTPWKKAAAREDSWGVDEWPSSGPADLQAPAWKREEAVEASWNRWTILDRESAPSSSASNLKTDVMEGSENVSEVADDWEKACSSAI